MSQDERTSALTALNRIRSLHQLPPVEYDYDSDLMVMSAALMIISNERLDHFPPPTWKCYSALGAQASGLSNMGFTSSWRTPEDDIIDYLIDDSNLLANNIGHRRWLLDPFLTKISYGRNVEETQHYGGGNVLRVIYSDAAALATNTTFVAYPYGDYPHRYFKSNAIYSFSLIASNERKSDSQQVDFSQAVVKVTNGIQEMLITDLKFDNNWYGIPNNIQFRVPSVTLNVQYTVTIENVLVNSTRRNYSYPFRIIP